MSNTSTEIRFYHLQTQSLDRALPALVAKAYSGGHRIHIRAANDKIAKTLSDAIWAHGQNSFIPHGTDKDGSAAHQPIWISANEENANNAGTIIITNGAEILPEAAKDFTLICDMFDGNNGEAVNAARARWKNYKEMELPLTYWQQNERGGWDQKA